MYIYIYMTLYVYIYTYIYMLYTHISTYIHTDTMIFCHRAWMDMVGSKECKHSISTRMAHSWALGNKKKGCHRMVGMRIPKYWDTYLYIHIYIYTYIYIYGGFHKWWYPNCWMVYFMENPIKMIKHGWFAGTPILGNHHIKKKNNHWVLISLHPYNQNVGMYIQVATFPSWVGDGTCVVEPQTSTEHIQSIWT
jgi:hypothetical protein